MKRPPQDSSGKRGEESHSGEGALVYLNRTWTRVGNFLQQEGRGRSLQWPGPQSWVSDSRAHSQLLASRVPGGLSPHLSLCPAASVTGGGTVEAGSPSWHVPHAAEMLMV